MKKITFLIFLLMFGVKNIHAQYCTSSGTAGSSAFIGQVCVPEDFPNCTTCCAQAGSYTNNSGLGSIKTLTPGGANGLIVGINTPGAGDFTYAFYIDLDGNEDFTGAGEFITSGSGSISFPSGGGTSYNANPVIPVTATNGVTRIRFITKAGTSPVTGPCETGFNGETEDFLVTISGAGMSGSCDIAIGSVNTAAPACPGGDGTITVNATCTSCTTIEYSLDNMTFQAGNTFTEPAGPYTVYVRDTGDNSCNDSSMTTVPAGTDTTPPTAVCQNTTVQLDGSGNASITAGDIDNGSSDNCGIASISVSPSTFTCANVGGNTVTLTVTDVNGNSSTCTATVTVADNVAPTAVCQNTTVQLDASGNASIAAGDIDNGSSDNCTVASLSVSPSAFTCANVGANTVTLTVTDVNGNSSSCTATVTVEDNENPVITCVADATRDTDVGVNTYTVQGTEFDATFTDNCTSGSISNDFNNSATLAGAVFSVGSNSVTWTVDDGNGQSAMCTTVVTVEGNLMVDPSGNLVYTDANGVDDDITITIDGLDYRVSDPNGGLSAGAGTTQDGTDVLIPIASVTGAITFNTENGNDSLTVNLDGGDYGVPVNYNGGTQTAMPGDVMALNGGGTFTDTTYNFLNENDGSIAITGNSLLSYTGLEPISSSISSMNVTLDYSSAAETITVTDAGMGQTTVDSNVGGEIVTFNNPTGVLTINSGDIGANIINLAGLASNYPASLDINGGDGGDRVDIQGDLSFAADNTVAIDAQTIRAVVGSGGSIATLGLGSIDLNATRDIVGNNGALFSSEDGGITMNANLAISTTINSDGITLNNASVNTSGNGSISLSGIGSSDGTGSNHFGVVIQNSSTISTSGTGGINVIGTGGDGVSANQGVRIQDSGTVVSTVNGNIVLTGTSGVGTGGNNEGADILFGAVVESLGTGSIEVNGTSQGLNNTGKGIVMFGTGSVLRTNGGGITMTGQGGGINNFNPGISIEGSSLIEDTAAGNILMNGTGADSPNSPGVVMFGNSIIRGNDGNIDITALGGDSTGNDNDGFRLDGSLTEVLGDGVITINGTSGNGGVNGSDAVQILNSQMLSNGGGITITGNGSSASTGNNNRGVFVSNTSIISDANSGNISISGSGGAGLGGNNGILISGGSQITATGSGNLNITGDSGVSNGNNNNGVSINGANTLLSTDAGDLSLVGTSLNGLSGAQNSGIRMDSPSVIETNDGVISITGTGGNGNGNFNAGILALGNTIQANGSGSIAVTGNATSGDSATNGIYLQASGGNFTTITSNGGGIALNGTASATATGGFNQGIWVRLGATISDTGMGLIDITGIGGSGNGTLEGVLIDDPNNIITSNGGGITITGTGGMATGGNASGIRIANESQISDTADGMIIFNGTGGTASNIAPGMWINSLSSISSNTGDMQFVGIATNTAGPFNQGIVLGNDATITSTSGDIELTGTTGGAAFTAIDIDPTNADTTTSIETSGDIIFTANVGQLNTPDGPRTVPVIIAGTSTFDGAIAPGRNIAQFVMNGDAIFSSGDTFEVEISGYTTPGVDFDQLVVTGTVDLTDATLTIVDNTGAPEDECGFLVLIDNDGTDAVTGTFMGLAEGDSIASGGITGKISYIGGDGNDVVLNLDDTPITVISGPVDIFTGTGAGDEACATIVNYDPVTIDSFVLDDNCGDATTTTLVQTGGLGTGAAFPVGTTVEEYTLTDNNGNDTVYTFEVTISDTTDPVIDCPDDDVIVEGDVDGNYSIEDYSSLVSDNCSSGDTLEIVQEPAAGTVVTDPSTTAITITATDEAGNVTVCEFNVVVDETLSIVDTVFNVSSIRMYPNPAINVITIDAGTIEMDGIKMYDVRGRLVQDIQVATTTSRVDISNLEAGVYLVQITANGKSITKRLIKE